MAPAALAAFAFTVDRSNRLPDVGGLRSDQVLVQEATRVGITRPPGRAALRRVRAVVPGADEARVRELVEPGDPDVPYTLTWPGDEGYPETASVGVATPGLVDALGLPPSAARHLAAGRVLALAHVPRGETPRHQAPVGTAALDAPLAGDDVVAVTGPHETAAGQLPGFVVPAGWPDRHGLTARDTGVLLRARAPLGGGARAALGEVATPPDRDAAIRAEVLGTPGPQGQLYIRYHLPLPDDRAFVGIVGAGLGVFTLLVVAVALALSAAESRDEAALLAALGAPPRVRRSVAGWQAALLPLAGTLIGVPLGLAAAVAMVLAGPDDARHGGLSVPWALVGGLLVVLPLVSGLGARAVAAVAVGRRSGGTATLAFD